MKNIILFGATGSIGTQTLDCVRKLGYKITAMAAKKNIGLFEKQIREFLPQIVAVHDAEAAAVLREKISDLKIPVLDGEQGVASLVGEAPCDLAVNGIVGIVGIRPTLECVKKGINIATANKESLVVAGDIINALAEKSGSKIIPIDGEHSAIFQCLNGICPTENDIRAATGKKLKRLILTASGGAFWGMTEKEVENMTRKEALCHPNWSMGEKITVDCATMMNKGFEIIEAVRIFGVSEDRIDVIINRESIVHSMIEFIDNSVMSQMSVTDMRIAIQYALTYPERFPSPANVLDLTKVGTLSFFEPDARGKRAMNLCRQALRTAGTAPAILNAANEKAVADFLAGKTKFGDIMNYTEGVLNKHSINPSPDIDEILAVSEAIMNA